MKFKNYLITAASCMAILGTSVTYAEVNPEAANTVAQKVEKKPRPAADGINAVELTAKLDKALTGELALTDEQKENIKSLAASTNKDIEKDLAVLKKADDAIRDKRKNITSAEEFNALQPLMNDRALAMSKLMFVKEKFFYTLNNKILSPAQSDTMKKKVQEKMGKHFRPDPNAPFSNHRQSTSAPQ